jgi:hypothetical protein
MRVVIVMRAFCSSGSVGIVAPPVGDAAAGLPLPPAAGRVGSFISIEHLSRTLR